MSTAWEFSKMGDRRQDFANFLKGWIEKYVTGENFGSHMDPGDEEHVHVARAWRLKDEADAKGFSTEITALSRGEGGLVGYLKRQHREAGFRRRGI